MEYFKTLNANHILLSTPPVGLRIFDILNFLEIFKLILDVEYNTHSSFTNFKIECWVNSDAQAAGILLPGRLCCPCESQGGRLPLMGTFKAQIGPPVNRPWNERENESFALMGPDKLDEVRPNNDGAFNVSWVVPSASQGASNGTERVSNGIQGVSGAGSKTVSSGTQTVYQSVGTSESVLGQSFSHG